MKYFAMVGGARRGPFELDRLVDEGVMPDTYVWCKGMDDWTPANEVPDICRYFRQRLAGMHAQPTASAAEERKLAEDREQEEILRQLPPMAQRMIRKSGIRLTREHLPKENEENRSKALPIVLFFMFLLIMIFGFFLRYLL